MDKKKPRTKQERRQRQRRLERAMKLPKQSDQPPETQPSHAAAWQEQAPAKQPGRQKRLQITAADLQWLKYFDKLAPLLQRLHDEGCERDTSNPANSRSESATFTMTAEFPFRFLGRRKEKPDFDVTSVNYKLYDL